MRNWAGLPCHLLGSIVERLSVSDYFRFGSVCTPWASIVSDGQNLPRGPQKPYLLHPTIEGDAILVGFPNRNQHRITCCTLGGVDDLRGKLLVGSQYGWLALLDEWSEVSLFNPLTLEKIRLPYVSTIPQVKPLRYPTDWKTGYLLREARRDYDSMKDSYTFEQFRTISFKKVVLSSRPTTATGGRGFTAMAIFTGYNRIAVARPGEDKWIYMPNCPFVTDIIYRNEKFLGVSDQGSLLAFDVSGPSLEFTEIAQGWGFGVVGIDKYLVDSAGDLLMVWRIRNTNNFDDKGLGATSAIYVMKFVEEQGTWLPLENLGDNSLFLGRCCSISLSVREIPELRPNCVYYTEVLWNWLAKKHVKKRMPRDVWVYYLVDKTVDGYAPTDHRLCWPPPIWIMPSLL